MSISRRIGDTVADAYVVDSIVGVGGMAVVAVASHTSQPYRAAERFARDVEARTPAGRFPSRGSRRANSRVAPVAQVLPFPSVLVEEWPLSRLPPQPVLTATLSVC